MTRMSSRPVTSVMFYAQDTQPTDEREGVQWWDGSALRIYDEDEAAWIDPSGSVPLLVTQEAVSFDESDVSVTGTNYVLSAGSLAVGDAKETGTTVDDWTHDSTFGDWSGWSGFMFNPNEQLAGISVNTRGQLSESRIVRHSDGQTMGTFASPGGDLITDQPLEAGVTYRWEGHNNGSMAISLAASFPFESADLDVTDGVFNSASDDRVRNARSVTALKYVDEATVQVGFNSIPTDIAEWDIITWQYESGDGSATFDVEINDGSGWSTLVAGVLPPVDISGVATDADVRVVANLSRADVTDDRPAVPYVARRGER